MPHQVAYTDTVVTADVFLKKKSADGKRELKIASNIKARLEHIISRGHKQPYFQIIERLRLYLITMMQSMNADQIDVAAIRATVKGKVGVAGHYLGVDIRVP